MIWTASANPTTSTSEGTATVTTFIGMWNSAISPTAHSTLDTPVNSGATTPCGVRKPIIRTMNSVTTESGTSVV